MSPGCGMGKSVGGCYAEAFSRRLGLSFWGPEAPRRFFGDKHWAEPVKWNRRAAAKGERRRVFCASMADVFEMRPDLLEPRKRLGDLIAATPSLDWQILTKRPENVASLAANMWPVGWPPNVWLGVTGENQEYFEKRVRVLAGIRGPAVRFVSCEPLLGPIDFGVDWEATENRLGFLTCPTCRGWGTVQAHGGLTVDGHAYEQACPHGCNGGNAIDWVIVGGESGHGPRLFDVTWARDIVRQCRESGTSVFVKQLGSNPVDGARRLPLLDPNGTNLDAFPADVRIREFPGA